MGKKMKTKRKKLVYVFQDNFKTFQEYVNAVDDVCENCVKEKCWWHDINVAWKTWRKSKTKYFCCDVVEVDGNGKCKRNGKDGEGEELDFYSLS